MYGQLYLELISNLSKIESEDVWYWEMIPKKTLDV
jgi:hypothetical protein